MNSSSPRVAIVGCGGIARAHIGAIPPEHIVALCDSHENTAQRIGTEFGLSAPMFDSLEVALNAQSPNVVVICTPPATHFDLASSALDAGVHVLCEKPIALSRHEADTLVEAARERNLLLRTSAKYRFAEGVCAAKLLLSSGEMGALQNLRIAFGAPFDFTRSWHANLALSGGGVWMDNGPHAIDLVRYFVGRLRVESLHGWQGEGELETEGRVHLRSDSGVPVEIALSWLRSFGDHFAVLECQQGTLEIGWSEALWRPHAGQSRRIAGGYDKAACFSAQWQGFLSNDARLAPEDGARAVELIEAIYLSAKENNTLCQPVTRSSSTKCDSRATSPLCR